MAERRKLVMGGALIQCEGDTREEVAKRLAEQIKLAETINLFPNTPEYVTHNMVTGKWQGLVHVQK
jgi:hypothetical protein